MRYRLLVEYLKQGWRFAYEPGTFFIGISHERGGRQSLCAMARHHGCRDQFGMELAELIHNAMVPTDATHVLIEDQTLVYYRVSLPNPASGMGIKVMSRWEGGEWKVQTGGPLPWDTLILLVPEKTIRPDAGDVEPVACHWTGADNRWHVYLWGEEVFTTANALDRDQFMAFLKIHIKFAKGATRTLVPQQEVP